MPHTLKDSLLPVLDRGTRPLGGLLGLRPWTVVVRTRSWSGERPGDGTSTNVDVRLTVGGAKSPQPIRVEEVSEKAVVASGGLYRMHDVRVGPLTQAYADLLLAGGFAYSKIDPAVGSVGREVEYLLRGPPTGGSFHVHEKVAEEAAGALHFYVVLRSTGQKAAPAPTV